MQAHLSGITMSKFRGVKTNNGPSEIKAQLREYCLERISDPRVLEVFCGSGVMYDRVWNNADHYLGIDKKKFFDKRNKMCGDAEKLVSKLDPSLFNIFDIDAYGSPYTILKMIVDRVVPSGDMAFILTDGVNMDLKMGRICKPIREMTGIEGHIAKRAHVIHENLIKMIIAYCSKKTGMTVECVKIARGKTGAAMKYYAFILKMND